MNAKIDAINSLVVEDYSCNGGECEYVLVQDLPENRNILLNAGFTSDDLQHPEVKPDPADDRLNIAYLAFTSGADWFYPRDGGFGRETDMRISIEDGDEE